MEAVRANSENQEESIDDDRVAFVNIEELQNHGINAGDIKKLKVCCIYTFFHLLNLLACWHPYSYWRIKYFCCISFR
jgi:hypothetical protein